MGVADCLLCLSSVPMLVFLERDVVLPCSLCLAFTCGTLGWAIISSFHHVLIAMHRWLSVTFPTRDPFSPSCVILQIAVCWGAGGLVSWIPAMGWGSVTPWDPLGAPGCSVPCAYQNVLSMQYLVYVIFDGCVLAPFLTISVLYALVFRALREQCRRCQCQAPRLHQRQCRITRSLVTVVAIYGLSRMPFNVVAMVQLYCSSCWLPPWLVPSSLMLATFSAASNPFMYLLCSAEICGRLRGSLRPRRVAVLRTVDKPRV
ncbi:adenosine receptor A2a-like [Rhinatrema bivittatum]|uniref:adenosine receptor A2a-like n=1 Tax=Rhinatrema bivittatum TaxID=194408 RepID=UPI00112B31E4|nr:adenosine receptor A2a-like [Rhinatrema bivittatum]